ncbi:hypothetical protein QBC36DRAFT_316537, partial [Triangularia setosa]
TVSCSPHLALLYGWFVTLVKRNVPKGDGCVHFKCTPATCITPGACFLRRRTAGDVEPIKVWNETSSAHHLVSAAEFRELLRSDSLDKRAFTDFYEFSTVTLNDLKDYLPRLARAEPNSHIRSIIHSLHGVAYDNTVSHEVTMNEKVPYFQIGTGALHGCTVFTMVSRRAVYMAHYWELAAMGGVYAPDKSLREGEILSDPVVLPETDGRRDNFQKRVLNALLGGEQDPMTKGNPFTLDLFSRADDQTRIFIFTPGLYSLGSIESIREKIAQDMTENPGANEADLSMNYLLYKNRIKQIIDGLKTKFGSGKMPALHIVPYFRLNYWEEPNGDILGPDGNEVGRSHRGNTFFQ